MKRRRRFPPNVSAHYFFLAGRCVSADPAAVFDDLLVEESRRALDAAEAAFAEVVLLDLNCDNAEPAADLDFLLLELSLKTLDAADAARWEVRSIAILSLLYLLHHCNWGRVFKNNQCQEYQQQREYEGARKTSCYIGAKLRPKFVV